MEVQKRRHFLAHRKKATRTQLTDEVLNIERPRRPEAPKAVVDPLHPAPNMSDADWDAEAERLLAELGYDVEARRREKLTMEDQSRRALRSHQPTHKRLKSR